MKRIEIETNEIDQLRFLAEQDYPAECCGFLLGKNGPVARITHVLSAELARRNPSRYFIPAATVRRVEKSLEGEDTEILGFFHSHPDAGPNPSRTDLDSAWPGYFYLIISTVGGEAGECKLWQMRDDRSGFQEIALRVGGWDLAKAIRAGSFRARTLDRGLYVRPLKGAGSEKGTRTQLPIPSSSSGETKE